jgi:hypothetical protein
MVKERPKNIPENHKWCHKCENSKPNTEYFNELKRPGEVQNVCKECVE